MFEEVFDCAIVQEYVASCEILTLVTGKRQIYANFFHSSRTARIEAVWFFEAKPKPKVYSILPSIISAGKENIITVNGCNFYEGMKLMIDLQQIEPVSLTQSAIVCSFLARSTIQSISLQFGGSFATSITEFLVVPPVLISAVNPIFVSLGV